MGHAFITLVQRDLILALRRRTDLFTTLFFFIIVTSLFPLGVGTEKLILLKLGPGVVWVAALLASLLALERLFASDDADGTLEQLLLTPQPVFILVVGKVLAHWLLTGLPLVVLAPVIGLQYGLPTPALEVTVWSLLIGTPVLSLVGAIGAALTLGVRGGGILLSLLILPLYIPILIYGSGAIVMSMSDPNHVSPYLTLLTAILIAAAVLAPWATAAALKISVE